jgi:MFS superfamily sulfate permease-like transporter
MKEIFAAGISNLGSSFFACFPSSSSLSRTVVLTNMNAKTQVANGVSATIVMIFSLTLVSLLSSLPNVKTYLII